MFPGRFHELADRRGSLLGGLTHQAIRFRISDYLTGLRFVVNHEPGRWDCCPDHNPQSPITDWIDLEFDVRAGLHRFPPSHFILW